MALHSLNAVSTSNLPISNYTSSNSGVARITTISGVFYLDTLSAGSTRISAIQNGNAEWNPATGNLDIVVLKRDAPSINLSGSNLPSPASIYVRGSKPNYIWEITPITSGVEARPFPSTSRVWLETNNLNYFPNQTTSFNRFNAIGVTFGPSGPSSNLNTASNRPTPYNSIDNVKTLDIEYIYNQNISATSVPILRPVLAKRYIVEGSNAYLILPSGAQDNQSRMTSINYTLANNQDEIHSRTGLVFSKQFSIIECTGLNSCLPIFAYKKEDALYKSSNFNPLNSGDMMPRLNVCCVNSNLVSDVTNFSISGGNGSGSTRSIYLEDPTIRALNGLDLPTVSFNLLLNNSVYPSGSVDFFFVKSGEDLSLGQISTGVLEKIGLNTFRVSNYGIGTIFAISKSPNLPSSRIKPANITSSEWFSGTHPVGARLASINVNIVRPQISPNILSDTVPSSKLNSFSIDEFDLDLTLFNNNINSNLNYSKVFTIDLNTELGVLLPSSGVSYSCTAPSGAFAQITTRQDGLRKLGVSGVGSFTLNAVYNRAGENFSTQLNFTRLKGVPRISFNLNSEAELNTSQIIEGFSDASGRIFYTSLTPNIQITPINAGVNQDKKAYVNYVGTGIGRVRAHVTGDAFWGSGELIKEVNIFGEISLNDSITFAPLPPATYLDTNGIDLVANDPYGSSILFESLNPSIALISGNKVYPRSAGTTSIKAYRNNRVTPSGVVLGSETLNEFVVNKASGNFSFDLPSLSLDYKVGENYRISVYSDHKEISDNILVLASPQKYTGFYSSINSGINLTFLSTGSIDVQAAFFGTSNFFPIPTKSLTISVSKGNGDFNVKLISGALNSSVNQPIVFEISGAKKDFDSTSEFPIFVQAPSGITFTRLNENRIAFNSSSIRSIQPISFGITGRKYYEDSPAKRYNISFGKTNQTIFNFNNISGVVGQTLILSGSTSSNLPLSYRSLSSVVSISGNTLKMQRTGSATIIATQSGNANFNSASTARIASVLPGSGLSQQTVGFNSLTVTRKYFPNILNTISLFPTFTNAKFPIMYTSSNPSVCLISGMNSINNIVPAYSSTSVRRIAVFVGTGSATISGSHPGGSGYLPAAPVSKTFILN